MYSVQSYLCRATLEKVLHSDEVFSRVQNTTGAQCRVALDFIPITVTITSFVVALTMLSVCVAWELHATTCI